MLREILHIDIRDFCIALERQRRPDLREWPVVVAPGQGRTVVQAVSPEAREEGIHPGMVLGPDSIAAVLLFSLRISRSIGKPRKR